MTKEEAIIKVLRVLKNPMLVMSPAKNEALTLAEEYCINAKDLIEAWSNITMRV